MALDGLGYLPADGRRATRSAVGYFTTSGIAATQGAVPIWRAFFLKWRRAERTETSRRREPTREERAIDLSTGWQISPLVAAALCLKPTRLLTRSQAVKVTVLKEASPSFVVMRRLAMRFRGLLGGDDPDKLGSWLDDARHSGIHALQQFAGRWPATSTPLGTRSPNNGTVARPKARPTD